MRAGGYIRVSSDEQASSGLGLAAQRAAIEAEVGRRSWELVWVEEDAGASGKSLDRPGLSSALSSLRDHAADVLVVSRLDRLTRSVKDFAHLLELSAKQRWALVALDLGVDTSTATGEAMAYIVGTFSQMERRLIGERTKAALQQARMRGTRLGAPVSIAADVQAQILARRKAGATLQQIAAELTSAGIKPPRGGVRWYHATIRQVLSRQNAPSFPRGRRRPKNTRQ